MIDYFGGSIGEPVEEIDTPALLIDLPALDRNIDRMAKFGSLHGIGIRPHAKAHKTAIIAQMQMRAGAVGLCCQKLGEAEALVAGGITELTITNEVVESPKLKRLAALARFAQITVAIDALAAAEALSRAAQSLGTKIGVIVDVDVGQERCGVAPGAPALEIARKLIGLPNLTFRGLQGYQGKLQHVKGYDARARAAKDANSRLMEARSLLERHGLPLDVVTGGGTGTYDVEGVAPGMTDIQPGSYIFMDRAYREIGGKNGPVYDDFETALMVLSTVMSTPTTDRVVVDAGLKSLSNDSGSAQLIDCPGWIYSPAGDEHGVLLREADGKPIKLGHKVHLRPSHCDTTVNLFDRFHGIENGRLVAVWQITGRGKSQ